MIQISDSDRRRAFSIWLRTGRLPQISTTDGIERKFNPWHDPFDGRFTFAGSGRHYGAGGAGLSSRANDRNPGSIDRQKPRQPRIAARPSTVASPPMQAGQPSRNPPSPAAVQPPSKPTVSRRDDPPNPVAEFIVGAAEGGYGVMKGTVAGAYAALTTSPVTTVGKAGREIAAMIDTVIAAEDTPARVHVSRAAHAVASASPRDIGRATGTVAGNVALAFAPGAALAQVSARRRLLTARPSTGPFPPPEIGWLKENLGRDSPAKRYNDTAPGARPGQAPTLMRTLADGSQKPVKFDGVDGEYLVDRKFGVSGKPRAIAQILRQSEALAQNRQIGIWEVPTQLQKDKALKLLQKLNVRNIKFRIVRP
ncbi:hypothetical protein [Sphingomonas sp. SFZ2018-12]|uniref:hypothetical protein n=1 Tax=Sphingomonas sp. SFZ2018-12 TaxID=2683197 RepID=UPI001F118BD3|nr:hypothetical protein [Sphingomonas sp. SFZ2018-12]